MVEIPINISIIRVMRVLRIARVLKLLKTAKGVRRLLETVAHALPQVGNLVGSTEGPVMFQRAYNGSVSEWLEHCENNEGQMAIKLIDPIDQEVITGSFVGYADDTFKKKVIENGMVTDALQKSMEDEKAFNEYMQVGGWKRQPCTISYS